MPQDAGRDGSKAGREFDIREPAGSPQAVLHGGLIDEWERIDRLLIRRRIVGIMLLAVIVLIIAGLIAAVRGAHPTAIAALAALVGGPLAVIVRYYFSG